MVARRQRGGGSETLATVLLVGMTIFFSAGAWFALRPMTDDPPQSPLDRPVVTSQSINGETHLTMITGGPVEVDYATVTIIRDGQPTQYALSALIDAGSDQWHVGHSVCAVGAGPNCIDANGDATIVIWYDGHEIYRYHGN